MQLLRERIIGQDAALNEIEKMLHVVKADFSSPDRSLSVTLMLAPTGVGKTETVRLIAEAIYGRPDAFCRIDDLNTELIPARYALLLGWYTKFECYLMCAYQMIRSLAFMQFSDFSNDI